MNALNSLFPFVSFLIAVVVMVIIIAPTVEDAVAYEQGCGNAVTWRMEYVNAQMEGTVEERIKECGWPVN